MMMKPANDMRRAAQSMAPVATGALRGSIKAAPMLERPGAIVWQDGSEADYGRYVEWGTSNMAAQPFMRPAVEATRSTFASALASDIPDILEEAAAQTRWKAK
jgi:HK97 gp10 family phage protein